MTMQENLKYLEDYKPSGAKQKAKSKDSIGFHAF